MHVYLHDALLFSLILNVAGKSLKSESELLARSPANITDSIPSPLVVPVSQYWDGIDGLWSSFALRVGTPAQDVRVLVSTNSPETLVVLPIGCTSAAINPVPNDCATSRGGLFNPNTSTTWRDQGVFGINQDGVGFEADLGYSQHADYGLETLGLGFVSGGANGPTLENQTVAGIATASPFYLGVLGLNSQPVNYSVIGNSSAPSYFSTLRSQEIIPSLSWSFTAGAKYRLKAGQYAQLIFGGYDTSRFTPNSATFTLNQDIDRDIVVAIQSITYSGTTQSTLLSNPIFAFIESTDPNLWLPEAACKAFEQAFGISIDNSTGLYLLNATQYTQLQTANPQVTFTLSNSLLGGETVSIVLPFNAFGLSTSPPFTPTETYYFPLRKAANDTQYTLGRAFLQEAYLTVDYERGNFSVSQCVWQDGLPEQISAIISPSYRSSPSNPAKSSLPKPKPVGTGVVTGAAIGGVVFLAVAGGIAYYFFQQRQHTKSKSSTEEISLTHFAKDNKDISVIQDPNSPHPPYKNLDAAGDVHRSDHPSNPPDGELGTQGQIFQMPTTEHSEGDYSAAYNKITSDRRAASTPQIDGISVAYELYGSEPMPTEMDDERSRSGLSPMPTEMDDERSRSGLSPSTVSPSTLSPTVARMFSRRRSSRSSSPAPVSETL